MKNVELREVKRIVEDNIVDVHDLVKMLELTIEDVMGRFPDKLMEHKEKFMLDSEEDYYEDDNETQV